ARALTTLEKLRLHAPTVAMASMGGPLLYRIQRLLGGTPKRYGPSRVAIGMAITVRAIVFGVNGSWLVRQAQAGVSVQSWASAGVGRWVTGRPSVSPRRC